METTTKHRVANEKESEEASIVDGIDNANITKIEAADEWKSSCEYFNYHATFDDTTGFVTIKFNFRGDLAIPPVFDVVAKELRDIVITRNVDMDTEAEHMAPDPIKGGPGFLCVAFYEFKGGLIIGSREHILKNKVPETIFKIIDDAVNKT